MAGRSLRKAFRKFFRLRRSNSEPKLHPNPDPQSRTSNTFTASHALLSRVRSQGSGERERNNGDNRQFPDFVVPIDPAENERPVMDEVADKINAARSIKLAQQSLWYWGPINASVAETILENEPDGTFLVRDSNDDKFLFSLSCKYDGKVGHVRIEHTKCSFMFRKIPHYKSDNIKDFIETAVEHSRTGRMQFMTRPRPGVGATEILLLYPLSRRRTVQSLQHLSRFAVLQSVRNRDCLKDLPIPLALKKYCMQTQYFVELDKN